jgi:hypothetical protein
MRYQLNIYAPLAIFAGWTVIQLIELRIKETNRIKQIFGILGKGIAAFAVIGTIIYGIAFSNIYTNEEPRHEASKWIYQNVPGPITLPIQLENGETYLIMEYLILLIS